MFNILFDSSWLLLLVLIIPLIGSLSLLLIKESNTILLQKYTLVLTLITFVLSVLLFLFFDPFQLNFQGISVWEFSLLPGLSFSTLIGIDGISLLFIVLTTFLFPFCILVNWNQITQNIKEYLIAFLLLETFLIAVFSVLDLLFFYIFFESALIPIFLYIGVWGSRERKIYAAYLLFLYTLVGSLFMLLGILVIYTQTGTTDLQLLWSNEWAFDSQCILWLSFFASFAVKIPMFPFHIWLPEAHVEAPTAGSVLLAGVLLKLGGYGFLRFSIPMFPEASHYFLPLIYTLSILAIIYTSLTTMRQTDIKRIIAYSSVGHMNLVVLGLFVNNIVAMEGAFFLMLSHGIVSGGLFLAIGCLYHQHKTRLLKYYGGLVQVMPMFVLALFFFSMGNLSLPGTSSFVGEFMILLGAFQQNIWMSILAGATVLLGACYTLWFFNRISFGNLQLQAITLFSDLSKKDTHLMIPLVYFILVAGIFPNFILAHLHGAMYWLVFADQEMLYTFTNTFANLI